MLGFDRPRKFYGFVRTIDHDGHIDLAAFSWVREAFPYNPPAWQTNPKT